MRSLSLALLMMFSAVAEHSYAQGSVRDTSLLMVPVTLSYAYQLPGGDLRDRFGPNHALGISALAKLPSNFLFGGEFAFMFGNKVREEDLGNGLQNSFDQIIDQDGKEATILVFERGYTLMASIGKLIPAVGPNPNSGILLKLSGGYMRHKIRIESQNNVVPQLEGDYLEGYDRLTAGVATQLEVGYLHISNKRFTNFYIGFHTMLGFTDPLRAVNFDTGRADPDGRVDSLTGLRLGWTLPVYRRKADSFYLY